MPAPTRVRRSPPTSPIRRCGGSEAPTRWPTRHFFWRATGLLSSQERAWCSTVVSPFLGYESHSHPFGIDRGAHRDESFRSGGMDTRAMAVHRFEHALQVSNAVHSEANQSLFIGTATIGQPRNRERQKVVII